jgi:hypothetical protein
MYYENMDIMLNMAHDGRIALTCDGVFDSLIEGVELHYESSQLAIKFADVPDPVMLNCPVDLETIDSLMDQKACAIGFFLGRELASAVYVPFSVSFYGMMDEGERRMLQ